MKIVLFSCSAETYFRPLPYTFLTPSPRSFLPSFLLFQVLGFFSLAWFWPKAQKRRFRKRLGHAQGTFVCFGTGAGNLAGLSHGGSFKETSVFASRCRPLSAPQSAAMGEMQGALARARLESLLRPRHKKRAEAQKRSESVLLSGLGKHCRPARGGLSSGGVWVGGGRMETGGRRRTEAGGCESGTGSGDRGEGEVGAEGAQRCSAREYSRGNGKSPGLPTPPVPSVCPGGGRPSAAPTPGSCSHSRWNPHPCQGGQHSPPRIRRPATRIRPGLGQQPERRRGAEPSDGRGPERRFLIVPPAPPPRRRRVYKGGRSPERTVG